MSERELAVRMAMSHVGSEQLRVAYAGKVVGTCPNAAEGHEDGIDRRPSYAVFWSEDRGAHGVCLSCGFKEPLYRTLLRKQFQTGKNVGELILAVALGPSEGQKLSKLKDLDFDAPVEIAQKQKRPEIETLPESTYAKYRGSVPSYALKRGLKLETCMAWELGYDRMRSRLMFAVRGSTGELVGMTGRLITDPTVCVRHYAPLVDKKCPECGWSPLKYLHSPGKWRNQTLYGEHMRDDRKIGMLVEGTFDVLGAWQDGARNVVAAFGTMVSDWQIEKMRSWWDELVVWGDPDKAGSEMETSVIARFEQLGGKGFRVPEKPPTDVGDLQGGEIRKVLENFTEGLKLLD